MEYTTTVKNYSFSRRALEAWAKWRFAAAIEQGAKVVVKNRDGDFIVCAPEELSRSDQRALKRSLKGKEDWTPPYEAWGESS